MGRRKTSGTSMSCQVSPLIRSSRAGLSLSLSLSRARALSLSNYQGKNECEKCLGENRSLELRDSTSSAQPHSCYLFFGSEAERDQWCQVLCFYFSYFCVGATSTEAVREFVTNRLMCFCLCVLSTFFYVVGVHVVCRSCCMSCCIVVVALLHCC